MPLLARWRPVLLLLPSVLVAQTPPNGTLTVTYRQRTEGHLSSSLHRMELSCWDGHCTNTALSLNQCLDLGNGEVFYPKIERTTTDDNSLTLRTVEPGVLTADEMSGEATFRYRWEFTTRTDTALAARLRLGGAVFFSTLTGFSGAATKDSKILKKVISWDLVPLRGGGSAVTLDCPVWLEGVP